MALCRFAPLSTGLGTPSGSRSEEHTSELQSHSDLVCRLLLAKKKLHRHGLDRPILRMDPYTWHTNGLLSDDGQRRNHEPETACYAVRCESHRLPNNQETHAAS